MSTHFGVPRAPSYLHVRGCGYLAALGWSVKFLEEPCPHRCVVFTYENTTSLRRDDFHKNLIKTVRDTYEDSLLEWIPR